jgi:hypothetical protein
MIRRDRLVKNLEQKILRHDHFYIIRKNLSQRRGGQSVHLRSWTLAESVVRDGARIKYKLMGFMVYF